MLLVLASAFVFFVLAIFPLTLAGLPVETDSVAFDFVSLESVDDLVFSEAVLIAALVGLFVFLEEIVAVIINSMLLLSDLEKSRTPAVEPMTVLSDVKLRLCRHLFKCLLYLSLGK